MSHPFRARIRANSSRFWGIFWIDVSKPEIAKSEFIFIAKLLGTEASSVEQACMLLSNTKKPCLLILDNADDPHFDYHVYLPSGMPGSIVITSRVADCNQYSTSLWEPLTNLDPEDSRALLLKAARIPEEHWDENEEAAERVTLLLGSHTLALIQAGAYITRRHGSLKDFPKTFQQQRRRLLEFRPLQAQSRYCDVYATFEASAEVLSGDALQLLCILSMLNETFLSLAIFGKAWAGSQQVAARCADVSSEMGDISSWDVSQLHGLSDMSGSDTGLDVLNEWHVCQLPAFIGANSQHWDPYRLEEAVYQLATLSLITSSEQNGVPGVSMHPLAHAWAKDRQSTEAKRQNWIATGSVITLSLRASTSREGVEKYLQPHIQSYVDEKIEGNIICGLQGNMLALMWTCSWVLLQMRDHTRLERLLDELFRETGLNPTQVEPGWVSLYHLLARNHHYNSHNQVTVDIMEQVVEMRRKALVETTPNGIAAEQFLAVAYVWNGQAEQAVKLLERVVEIPTNLSETHPYHLALQGDLARAYQSSLQIKKAVGILEHIVKSQTRLPETHADRLTSQHYLACAYLDDGRVEEAIRLLEHVVKIEAATLAEMNPSRLLSQYELARAYLNNGQLKEAIRLLEHIVKIEATTLAETNPSRLVSQHRLACAYLDDGQVEEAIRLLEHVIKIEATILAEMNPSRLRSQHYLACAYLDNGRVEEAIRILEHVVKIEATTLAETNPSRLESQHVLAGAYLKDGRSEEATGLFKHVNKFKGDYAF